MCLGLNPPDGVLTKKKAECLPCLAVPSSLTTGDRLPAVVQGNCLRCMHGLQLNEHVRGSGPRSTLPGEVLDAARAKSSARASDMAPSVYAQWKAFIVFDSPAFLPDLRQKPNPLKL